MPMKRILRVSLVITVIACGVLYGQRALVSAAPAGEADASLSQLVEPGQVSADARRTAFGGDGQAHRQRGDVHQRHGDQGSAADD